MSVRGSKEKEREFLIECIKLYRDLPALWKVKSKVYHDRDQKNRAYKILLKKYKEMYPEATKDDVKRKFNALRTNYRKELKKSEASAESAYEPTLWYYKELSFLYNEELAGGSQSTMSTPPSSGIKAEDHDRVCVWLHEESTESQLSSLEDDQNVTDYVEPTYQPSRNTFKRPKLEENLPKFGYHHQSHKKDDHRHWAMACAADLEKMDPVQQVYAKKAIAEILMEGQLGLLRRNSVKINEPRDIDHIHYSSSHHHCSSPCSSTPLPADVCQQTITIQSQGEKNKELDVKNIL